MMKIFAPDVVLRFRSGRILLHTAASALPPFETEQPALIGWLCQFARPTDVALSLAKLSPADRAAVQQVLDYLTRAGALVESETATATAPDEERKHARSRSLLPQLARGVYELSCDLLAFGPFAERELARTTGVGVLARLESMLAALNGFAQALAALRPGYVHAQASALGLDAGSRALKVHLGCGPSVIDSFVNIDVWPAPLALNVNWGLPFEDGSVSYLYLSHLLEHLFFPRDVQPLLVEIQRVLAPEGVVRIVVPDVEQCINAYVQNDARFFASRRETWSWWPENPTRLEDFLAYAGAGAEPAHGFESHKFGYDFETLARVLTDAGFAEVSRCGYMASAHAALRVDDHSAVAKARYGESFYSLFIEARRCAAN